MRRGSSYLFVMIIMFSVFIMLTISVSITRQAANNSFIYADNANLYYLAVDYAEKFVDEMNTLIDSQKNRIQKEVSDEIRLYIGESTEEYIFYEAEENLYAGNFYLKNRDFVRNNQRVLSGSRNNLYTDLYIEAIQEILDGIVRRGGIREYEIYIEEKGISIQYEILVVLSVKGGRYIFTSNVRNLTNGNIDSVEGEIVIQVEEHEEILYENYQFRELPDYVMKDSFLTPLDLRINESIYFNDIEWSIENPVAYYKFGEEIDISKFYDKDNPVATILIAEGENHIIHTMNGRENFTGIIYVKGDIDISEDITIEYKNNFLDIAIHDRVFRRKLYDYFGLTNFQFNNISEIFQQVKLSEEFSLEITALPRCQIDWLTLIL